MALSDIIEKYLLANETGLLSIKLEGADHLLKIYLSNGEIVSISFGAYKNEDCIKKLNGAVPIEFTFVKGIKSPSPPLPLTEKVIETLGGFIKSSKANGTLNYKEPDIYQDRIRAIEDYLTESIGPIASIIVDNIFSDMSYVRGSPMKAEDYHRFLSLVEKELPNNQKIVFRTKYGTI